MYTSRICPQCKNDRFPEETVVKEKRQKYVIYTCRICKYKDIERLIGAIKKPLWDPKWGFADTTEETGLPGDDSNPFFEEGPAS
jgi:hypothetical protein